MNEVASHPLVLSALGLSKSYPGTQALVDVDVEVNRGEVVSVLGENGAGKSTFAKIICGLERPDAGEIRIDGERVQFNSPRAAQAAGVALIPQELAYAPELTAAENIVLGHWPGRRGVTSRRQIERAAAAEMERFGIHVPLDRPAGTLPLADIQLIEVLKALRSRARLLILDEPTAALTGDEAERLLSIIRVQAQAGVGVIFISHRLDEVRSASDNIYIFRDGRITSKLGAESATRRELLERMTGVAQPAQAPRVAAIRDSNPVARLRGWTSDAPRLAEFDLDVGKGEVVSIFGLRGCGADAVTEGLAGVHRQEAGTLELDGEAMAPPRTPRAARRSGIAFVPADRRWKGLLMHRSVRENLTVMLPDRISRAGVTRTRDERRLVGDLVAEYDVRSATVDQSIATLSGGNQQKVLLASRLATHPRLMILQEPTRGVDAGARAQIHEIIREAAKEGAGVIVSTSDTDEAVHLGDRLLVLRGGEVVASLTGDDRDEDRALGYAVGAAVA